MNSTTSVANPVLCAVELAVELLRCRALYNASTAPIARPAPTAELYSYTALYSAIQRYTAIQLYIAIHYTGYTTPLCLFQGSLHSANNTGLVVVALPECSLQFLALLEAFVPPCNVAGPLNAVHGVQFQRPDIFQRRPRHVTVRGGSHVLPRRRNRH